LAVLPSDFDWKSSPAHVDLLSKFLSPRDIIQVLNWHYLKQTLNGNAADAIDRFVQTGELIPCDLTEVI